MVTKWCKKNVLTLNVKKTKCMTFGQRATVSKAHTLNILINNQPLKIAKTYTYLGITLDPSLSFSAHVAHVSATANHKTYLLNKIRKFLTSKAALNLYKAMILPYLDYGDVLYVAATSKSLAKLQYSE